MKTTNQKTIKWAYFPLVFCSTAVLSSQLVAEDFQETDRASYEYVGGSTRISVGVDTEFDGTAEVSQVISEDKDSATIADMWAGFNASGDDKGVKAGGARLNHNWVSRDSRGNAEHVNKVFGAYDRNEEGHAKATVGYGQETDGSFWEGYASKGLKDGKVVGKTDYDKKDIFEKAYDYSVGANAGTFLPSANMRVRGGLEYAWGEGNEGEDDATQTTVSAGIDKYFHDTPHSVSLDVAASRKQGGHNADEETQTRANLSYNYEFGRNGIYADGTTTKRVRVEIPGTPARPARTERRSVKVPYKVARQIPHTTRHATAKSCNVVRTTAQLGCEYFFRENSHVLVPAAQQRLKQIIQQVRRAGHRGNIMITGHACSGHGNRCSGNNSNHLAQRRAEMVKNFFARHGFPAHQLITRGVSSNQNVVNIDFAGSNVQRQSCGAKTTYRTVYDTKYRTEYKNVVVAPGTPATPGSVTWKTEVVQTQPTWVTRALRSTINYNRNVDTYFTAASTVDTGTRPGNEDPVAVNDSTMTNVNQSVKINVLSNDSDADGDTLSISSVGTANHGTAMISNGVIMYTPSKGFVGTDSFTYVISDGKGGTDTATVSVVVKDTNTGPSQTIDANDDSAMTKAGKPVTINVLGNDKGKNISIISVNKPKNGSAVISNGRIIYTPNSGFVGMETFKYTIKDAYNRTTTAYVKVNVMKMTNKVTATDDVRNTTLGSSVSIDVLNNDSDTLGRTLSISRIVTNPIHGTARISNGAFVYTPRIANVKDRFTYEITDGHGNTAQAQVTINVAAVKQGKTVAYNDAYSTWKNQAISFQPLKNDKDPEGDTLKITYVSMAVNGKASISGNTVTYTPNPGFYGQEVLTYYIEDTYENSSSAQIIINVKNSKY